MSYFTRIRTLLIFLLISNITTQALGIERPVERGHEVQNGDWSVVYRAKKIISEAKAHLKWQIQYGQWQLPENREQFKEVFRTREEVDQFFKFIERVKIPDFDSLGEFLPCELFCQLNLLIYSESFRDENGNFYFSSNFLRQIGRQNNTELEKIEYIYKTQIHILTKYVQHTQDLNRFNWIYPKSNVEKFIEANQFMRQDSFSKIQTLRTDDEKISIDENLLLKVINYGLFKNIIGLDIQSFTDVNLSINNKLHNIHSIGRFSTDNLQIANYKIKVKFYNNNSLDSSKSFDIQLKLTRLTQKETKKSGGISYYLDLESKDFNLKTPVPGWYDYHLSTIKDTEPFFYTFNKAIKVLQEAQGYLALSFC